LRAALAFLKGKPMSLETYHHIAKAASAGAPLVFAFHGTGGDEHQFEGLVAQILPEAGLIAPRGDVSEHGANRFFRRTGEGVYDMADLARRTAAMVGFIRAARAAYPASAVYALGYSNGANILASVLFQAPELFDRAALLHPLIPFEPAVQPGLAGKRVLITAGERDAICPLPLTRCLEAYFEAQGAESHLFTHKGGHEITQSELAEVAGFLQK
jgi:phospholipase/carboxylesterase